MGTVLLSPPEAGAETRAEMNMGMVLLSPPDSGGLKRTVPVFFLSVFSE